MRDYRTHLQAVLKRTPATVNNALAAVDDLYSRRGLGPANAARAELPRIAPKALDTRPAVRFLRAVHKRPSPRDRAIALVPFYAGARIAEITGLDTDDVRPQGHPADCRRRLPVSAAGGRSARRAERACVHPCGRGGENALARS